MTKTWHSSARGIGNLRYLTTALLLATGCSSNPESLLPPIETSLGATNLSTEFYVVFQVRASVDGSTDDNYAATPLLSPGATHRARFLDLLGDPCPQRVDLRVFLFERVNSDLPIGSDPGEQVVTGPHASAEILSVPACDTQVVETYTIVNWDAPFGQARVKLAQDTQIDAAIRASGMFSNVDAAWEVTGVDTRLASPDPIAATNVPIAGEVIALNGLPVPGIGVLIRTRFRLRLDDGTASNDPDAGFGEPIAVTSTDANGEFAFARPAGAYRVELFSDHFAFRPAIIDLETPSERIIVIAEPLP